MAVERLEDGKINCNGIILDILSVQENRKFLDWESHVEDIINKIKEKYPEFDKEKNKTLIDEITVLYEHALDNDDSWNYSADYAIYEHKAEIEKAISATHSKSENDRGK